MSYQPAIWQPCYNQSFTSRNLSTSPLTVAGLRGDLYDYKLMLVQYGVGANAKINVRPNGDSGTNYRYYRLYAGGSTVNAEYDNTAYNTWIINSSGTNSNHSSVFIGEITGKSGAERVMSFIRGNNYDTTYYSQFGDYWWKNTADELTSLVFHGDNVAINFDLIILRKLKTAQDAEWELVERKTLSSTSLSNGVFFSGLDGDRDEEYLLKCCFTGGADQFVKLNINGDTGANNYRIEALCNNQGSVLAYSNNTNGYVYIGALCVNAAQPYVTETIIKAKSGQYRQLLYKYAGVGGNSVNTVGNGFASTWWLNTADKIENLKISCAANATGYIELHRRGKSVSASKPTFETLKEVSIDGEFSQGYTFDLAGLGIPDADNESMLVLEYSGVSKTAGQANMYIAAILNGDTGTNYQYQHLFAYDSSTSAGSGTSSTLSTNGLNDTYPGVTRYTIFPKSGKYRPVLEEWNLKQGTSYYTGRSASWWLNTADKLRSIKVYATSENQTLFKGTITLKRLVP